jgi:3-oxoacyl-[acyl-carrier-protein] synthase III
VTAPQPIVSAPARIAALGIYAPERIVTNADFERRLNTSDEWIVQRTGIRRRRAVAEGQYSSHLAIAAVEDLLAHNPHVRVEEIDYIIVGSSTPDYAYRAFLRCCRPISTCRPPSAPSTSAPRAPASPTVSTWRPA